MNDNKIRVLNEEQRLRLIYLFMTCSVLNIGVNNKGQLFVEYVTPQDETKTELI